MFAKKCVCIIRWILLYVAQIHEKLSIHQWINVDYVAYIHIILLKYYLDAHMFFMLENRKNINIIHVLLTVITFMS